MSKQAMIVVLVGLNLFLLAGILFTVGSPPAAMAQRVGGAGNYLMVAAEVQDNYDGLYIFDLSLRRLHAFTTKKGSNKLEFRDSRDLGQDFRAR